jgi:hypothetical protein
MNTLLEKLFEENNVSPKDRFEINQIYSLLPDEKKQNLINNFKSLALKLKIIEKEIEIEREILIPESVQKVKEFILENRK